VAGAEAAEAACVGDVKSHILTGLSLTCRFHLLFFWPMQRSGFCCFTSELMHAFQNSLEEAHA